MTLETYNLSADLVYRLKHVEQRLDALKKLQHDTKMEHKKGSYVAYLDRYGVENSKYHVLFTSEELDAVIGGLIDLQMKLEREFKEL